MGHVLDFPIVSGAAAQPFSRKIFHFSIFRVCFKSCIPILPAFLMSILLAQMGCETNFVSSLMMESSTQALLSTEVSYMDAHLFA